MSLVLLGACSLLLFSGCLGRDYDQALRRITIPPKEGAASSDRVVIDANVRYRSAESYGLRWTNGNQTYAGRWTNSRGLTSFGNRMTGSNRWTGGRGTYGGGRLTAGWNTTSSRMTGGRQGTNGRITNSRITNSRSESNDRVRSLPRIRYRDR